MLAPEKRSETNFRIRCACRTKENFHCRTKDQEIHCELRCHFNPLHYDTLSKFHDVTQSSRRNSRSECSFSLHSSCRGTVSSQTFHRDTCVCFWLLSRERWIWPTWACLSFAQMMFRAQRSVYFWLNSCNCAVHFGSGRRTHCSGLRLRGDWARWAFSSVTWRSGGNVKSSSAT
jgi:hypothetical protein